jgi:hypothetical protein
MSEDKQDCPKYVNNEVCKARMDAMYAWIKATFASTIIAVALIIVQILRGG